VRALLVSALLVPVGTAAYAADWAGSWRFEGAVCGAHACTENEMSVGAFRRWSIAAKLRVSGTRVCGLYETAGAKTSDHLLVGEIKDGKVYAAIGQDTVADPAFFDRDDYARVPRFQPQQLLLLTLRGARLHVQPMRDRRTPLPEQWTLTRQSGQRANSPFSPALPWQTQFLRTCLGHDNPPVEAAARQLRALASAPGP
jgi:hypothetical protein